jgi:hypothetical protein
MCNGITNWAGLINKGFDNWFVDKIHFQLLTVIKNITIYIHLQKPNPPWGGGRKTTGLFSKGRTAMQDSWIAVDAIVKALVAQVSFG